MNDLGFAEKLGDRVKEARRFKEELRYRGGGSYTEPYVNNKDGLFDHSFFSDKLPDNGNKSLDIASELKGTELVISHILQDVAELKSADGNNIPPIFVDWGGGDGTSTRKLARHFAQFVFIVTNLAWDKSYLDDIPNLHFVTANTAELLKQTVKLADGKDIPLRGNVDLVHELKMLEHNPIADSDLLIMGRALSPYGIMLVGTSPSSINPYGRMSLDYPRHRDILEIGSGNLMKTGLKKIEDFGGRHSIYDVYANPKAPLVRIK